MASICFSLVRYIPTVIGSFFPTLYGRELPTPTTLDKKEKRAVWLLVLFIILCLIATYFPIRYLWKLKYPAPLDYEKLSQSVVKINTYSGKWKCTVCGFENSVTKKDII